MDIESITASALEHLPEPYFSEPNLTLTFNIGSGEFVIDEETGNPLQSSSQLIVECSVSEDEKAKMGAIPGGFGTTVLYLKGRCVNPKIMPPGITFESTAQATLTNPDESIINGNWRFTAIPQNRIKSYTETRGTMIKGILSTPTAV